MVYMLARHDSVGRLLMLICKIDHDDTTGFLAARLEVYCCNTGVFKKHPEPPATV